MTGDLVDFEVTGYVSFNLDEKKFEFPQIFPIITYFGVGESSIVVFKRSALEIYSEEHFDKTLDGVSCAAKMFKEEVGRSLDRESQRRLAAILFRSLDNAPFSIC